MYSFLLRDEKGLFFMIEARFLLEGKGNSILASKKGNKSHVNKLVFFHNRLNVTLRYQLLFHRNQMNYILCNLVVIIHNVLCFLHFLVLTFSVGFNPYRCFCLYFTCP